MYRKLIISILPVMLNACAHNQPCPTDYYYLPNASYSRPVEEYRYSGHNTSLADVVVLFDRLFGDDCNRSFLHQ